MWKKLWIGILLVSGLVLISTPFIKESIIDFIVFHASSEKLDAGQINENNQRNASFDFSAIHPPSFYDTLKETVPQNPKAIIGWITISSVKIHLPILKGTTNANLLAGATTMRPDQIMGEGNYPLAGHHMRSQSLLFGPLVDIKVGDRIVITDLKRDYIYEMSEKEIISEKSSEVIENTRGKMITLITCDKPTATSKRLVVHGQLLKITTHHE